MSIAIDKLPAILEWERLSDIKMRSIVFLDKPLWQGSALHLLVARKGVGKGTVEADKAARVTRGELGPKRNVIWIGSEDSASIDIKPRVIAAGGIPERIFLIKTWIQLPRDIDMLSNTIVEIGDVGLVIIDPVGNHITGKNSNSDTDIRDAIGPLNELADRRETMIDGIRHLSEKECANGALAAILGASAWVQVPRAVIGIARDAMDPRISHIQCLAGNRLPPDTPGRQFRIEGVLLPGLQNEVTRAVWLGDSSENVETLIGVKREPGTKRAGAREIILRELQHGPRRMEELKAIAIAEADASGETTWRAANELKGEGLVRSYNSGQGTPWYWELTKSKPPLTSSPDAENPHSTVTSPNTTYEEVRKTESLTS